MKPPPEKPLPDEAENDCPDFDSLQPKEFGDWRLKLDDPQKAARIRPVFLGFLRRMRVQADAWSHTQITYVPIRGWRRAIRLLLAFLFLLPLSSVMMMVVGALIYKNSPPLADGNFWLQDPVWFTIVGIVGYLSFFIFRVIERVLILIYVTGHEATHAVAAVMSFGRVSDFEITAEGGYVETDTDNLFIALSPYFVPFWMLVWMLLLWLLNCCVPLPGYEAWLFGGMGFWWTFHVHWTGWVIPREQPDLLENGLTFSLLVIMLMNVAVLLLVFWLFGIASPGDSWGEFLRWGRNTLDAFAFAFRWLLELVL